MDYIESFKKRYKNYLYAVNTYPNVMENEFKIAYQMMKVKDNNIILNIPAAGTDLKKYICNNNITYYEFETSPNFSSLGYNLCSFDNIPLENKSVDRIIVLASFHHVSIEDRPKIYKEFKRILKDDGLFIIGDVIKNSKQDKWLNEFVNKWNSKGHKGIFFDEKDENTTNLLENFGFSVEIQKKKYTWDFKNEEEMVDFVINLFGLDLIKKEDLLSYIKEYLDYNNNGDNCSFDWELIYFISSISKISPTHIQPL
jgi:SAM-dependent methyltransferase